MGLIKAFKRTFGMSRTRIDRTATHEDTPPTEAPVITEIKPSHTDAAVAVAEPDDEHVVANGLADTDYGDFDIMESRNARAADDLPPAPQNKRELMEELQKNYREVVTLVRKVNTHLDRVETRSGRLMEVADRLEPALDRISIEFEGQTERALAAQRDMANEIVGSIEKHLSAGREGQERVVEALDIVGRQIEQSGIAQSRLVETMAVFRETMNGIAVANERSSAALESIRQSNEQREAELVRTLRTNIRWNLLIFIVSATTGLSALAVALFVLFNRT